MKKRGQLSIETIIIIILALLVLVIVAAAFSGGMKELWSRITGISSTTQEVSLDSAVTQCKALCGNMQLFNQQSYVIKDVGAKACNQITTCP